MFNVSQCNTDKLVLAEQLVRNPAAVTLMRTFFAVYPSDKTLVKKNILSYQLQCLSSKNLYLILMCRHANLTEFVRED